MTDNYAEACKAAATVQGLDPVVEYFERGDFEVEVLQTGGFCMVAKISLPNTDRWVGITQDDEYFTDAYLVVGYEGNDWEHDMVLADSADLPQAARLASEYLTKDYEDYESLEVTT